MRLSDLKPGETGIIVKILGHGAFRKRMLEMGFVRGREVRVVLDAPLHDPVKYQIMDYEVSLRRSEAELVEVVSVNDNSDSSEPTLINHTKTVSDTEISTPAHEKGLRTINIALIGNPNCGKTTLFNVASGAREHVGNYSGVTVDAKSGTFKYKGFRFNIVDLPGTYSLASYSPEELYVRRYLKEKTPDIIINVVDASNLERNLYLTTELIDMDRSMVIALNMADELERSGRKLDYKTLGEMIGVPIVPTSARNGTGINELFDTVISVYEGTDPAVRHIHVNLGSDIEKALSEIKDTLKENPHIGR
ncbi:MAG: 50S ribosome-binding GTPase, partial [Duncaniella sp.]|nr:50S ribosome-binding GTPase [Duncaniella sp.]